jgi:hypothetical protein
MSLGIGQRRTEMAGQNSPDLLTWILLEAYKNGPRELSRKADAKESCDGFLGSYYVSRQAIHQEYFGRAEAQQGLASDASQASNARRLARLKNAATLARSVKRLLEQRLIVPPNLGGLKTGIRHVLSLHAEYIFLTEQGIQAAKALLSNP